MRIFSDKSRPSWLFACLSFLMFLLLVPVGTVFGATITVTSTADSGAGTLRQAIADAVSGDTINFSVSGNVQLTSAELAINKNLTITGPATIERTGVPRFRIFSVGAGYTVTMTDLIIRYGYTADGGDDISAPTNGVDGGGIYNSGTLTLNSCTVSGCETGLGGSATGTSGSPGASGGLGGGIYNAGTLNLYSSTISGNGTGAGGVGGSGGAISGGTGGAGGDGGGIYNAGTLLIDHSTISMNSTGNGGAGGTDITGQTGSNGGNGGLGGGIANASGAGLSLDHATISGNWCGSGGLGGSGGGFTPGYGGDGGSGGGIAVLGGSTIQIDYSTIDSNTAGGGGSGHGTGGPGGAGGDGGGIFTTGSTVTLGVSHSTLSNNTAGVGGAGVSDFGGTGGYGGAVQSTSAGGTEDYYNCTISGNSAGAGGSGSSPGTGGGSGAFQTGAGVSASFDNCTIYNNTAGTSGGSAGNPGGISVGAAANLKNTILAGNLDGYGFSSDCSGLLTSYGYNIVGNTSTPCSWTSTTGDQWGTSGSPLDPLLDVLGDYGGPTQTHAPLSGTSPGVDLGAATDIAGGSVTLDQRDVARPQNVVNDIGAFEWPITFTLTQNVAGTGAGTVVSTPAGINCDETTSPCSNTFDGGQGAVSLAATADIGSSFIGWSGDCAGTLSPFALTLDTDKNCTATFDFDQYTVSVSTTGAGGGTVTSDIGGINCGATCSDIFNYSDSVVLTATPDTGSTFAGWSGDCSGMGTSFALTVDSDKNCSAAFDLNQYNLVVTTSGTGSGTVSSDIGAINCGATCSDLYFYGDTVNLTATPAAGSTFIGWTGDCSGTASPFALLMDGAKSCDAQFDIIQYQVSVSKGGSGTGTVTADSGAINCGATCSDYYGAGTSLTLTATPGTGSVFNGWSGDCSGTMASTTFTVNAAYNCTATFDLPNLWALTVISITPSGGGSVTATGINCPGDCSETFNDGDVVTVEAIPATGYQFTGWGGDLSGTTNPISVTMTASKNISAQFTPITTQLTVHVDPGAGGTVTGAGINCPGDCSETFSPGDTTSLTATPASGYNFIRWLRSGSPLPDETANPLNLTMDSDMEITAQFGPPGTLSTTVPAGETVEEFGIISIPLVPDDPSPEAVFGVTEEDYDTTTMRIGRWKTTAEEYDEFPLEESLFPGWAGWVLFRDGRVINFEGTKTPTIGHPSIPAADLLASLFPYQLGGREGYSFQIPQGWNQIGNPYDYSIDISAVWVYDSGGFAVRLTDASNTLSQQYFWLYNGGEYTEASSIAAMTGGWLKVLASDVFVFFAAESTSPDRMGDIPRAAPDVERPPAPPGSLDVSGASGQSGGSGGGGGGGGGCFLNVVGD